MRHRERDDLFAILQIRINFDSPNKSYEAIIFTLRYFQDIMVHIFGDVVHLPTSFLASNLSGTIAVDETKSTTSNSEANFVTSSDITDIKKFLCDMPIAKGNTCGCGSSNAGLVSQAGRTFAASTVGLNGAQTATMGPLGIQPANSLHPSFRFAQKVSDVQVSVTDVTFPGNERLIWDAKFRLPDGGSTFLPPNADAIGGKVPNFQKMCSALNSWRNYKVEVMAGGDAPIDQSLFLRSEIITKPDLIDPATAESQDPGIPEVAQGGATIRATAPSILVDQSARGPPSTTDAVPATNFKTGAFAIRSTTSFAQTTDTSHYYVKDGTVFVNKENSGFPAVTATTFTQNDDCCCGPKAPISNPPGCHKPPVVTIHTPSRFVDMRNFL